MLNWLLEGNGFDPQNIIMLVIVAVLIVVIVVFYISAAKNVKSRSRTLRILSMR